MVIFLSGVCAARSLAALAAVAAATRRWVVAFRTSDGALPLLDSDEASGRPFHFNLPLRTAHMPVPRNASLLAKTSNVVRKILAEPKGGA
jgi:hypothetical protein